MLLRRKEEILDEPADLFVIAIGTNDIRYRDAAICSMTAEDYVANVEALVQEAKRRNPGARFVLIAPWLSGHYDPVARISAAELRKLRIAFSKALEADAASQGFLFIDPNPLLEAVFRSEYPAHYLVDYIHPNAATGIELYSTAVLNASN